MENFKTVKKEITKHLFIFKKDVGKFKKGEEIDCFGGLVSGVKIEETGKTILFTDKEFFTYKESKEEIEIPVRI